MENTYFFVILILFVKIVVFRAPLLLSNFWTHLFLIAPYLIFIHLTLLIEYSVAIFIKAKFPYTITKQYLIWMVVKTDNNQFCFRQNVFYLADVLNIYQEI